MKMKRFKLKTKADIKHYLKNIYQKRLVKMRIVQIILLLYLIVNKAYLKLIHTIQWKAWKIWIVWSDGLYKEHQNFSDKVKELFTDQVKGAKNKGKVGFHKDKLMELLEKDGAERYIENW